MHAYVYVCACMRVYVHVYMYVYVYRHVCVYVYIYIYIRARVYVHMHSCRRILFICSGGCPISLLHARVLQVFLNTYMRVWGGLEVWFVSAFSWLALVTGVGGYVLAGVEIGV